MLIDKFLFSNVNDDLFKYKSEGKGIISRFTRYSKEWASHQIHTKQVILDWISQNKSYSKLNILGAGPLYDVPNEIFEKSNFKKIIFTEANINYLSFYKRYSNLITSPVFQDVTLTLSKWAKKIINLPDISISNFINILLNKNNFSIEQEIPFLNENLVLSVNLTSQIPIHWQYAIFNIFKKRFGIINLKKYESKLLESLQLTSQILIKNHFDSLIPRNSKCSRLIITDLKYYFPDNKISPLNLENENANIKNLKINILNIHKTSKKVILNEQDALFGFNLDLWLSTLPKEIKFNIMKTWVWAVVPKHLLREKQEFHIVRAIKLDYKKL